MVPGTQAGDLWYAHVYDPLRWLLGPHTAGPPPDPSVIPEFFGDTILVNGTVYPYLELEQRQYRFRMLNACNARFLNPRLVYAQGTTVRGGNRAQHEKHRARHSSRSGPRAASCLRPRWSTGRSSPCFSWRLQSVPI